MARIKTLHLEGEYVMKPQKQVKTVKLELFLI